MGKPKPGLKIGARGVDVGRGQTALNKYSVRPALKVDGDFGPKTLAGVGEFQERYRLKTSGEVDDDTWSILNPYRTALVFGLLTPRGLTLPQFTNPFDPSNSPLRNRGKCRSRASSWIRARSIRRGIQLVILSDTPSR